MKKIFIAALCTCIYTNVFAQLKIGIRVAPQITWSASDNKNTSTNGTRINAAYGLMIDKFFTENYAIGTEICIQSFGTNLNLAKDRFDYVQYQNSNYGNGTESLSYDYKLRYVCVPLMLKMRTNEIGNIRYYAEFGYGSGFLIRSKADVSLASLSLSNININSPDQEDEFKIMNQLYSDKVSSYRGSLIIGMGIQYKMFGNSLLVAGLRYDNGIVSFTKDDRWSTTLSNIALNIGVLF